MSRESRHSITLWDMVLAVATVALGVAFVAFGEAQVSGTQVAITGPGGKVLTFDLGQSRTMEVEGLKGRTVVSIDGGSVRFVSSPCPHKDCVRRGRISRSGEWIACVPNRVVATITGERTYDGITP